MQSRGVRRPSVRPSVCKLCANHFFYHTNGWIATKLAHDGPQMGLHPVCAQGQGQGQRSRDTGTSVMSRNVCYTVPSDVLSLYMHSLYEAPLHSSCSFQYKCQAAWCNVYIMEWATPSLTVGFWVLLMTSNQLGSSLHGEVPVLYFVKAISYRMHREMNKHCSTLYSCNISVSNYNVFSRWIRKGAHSTKLMAIGQNQNLAMYLPQRRVGDVAFPPSHCNWWPPFGRHSQGMCASHPITVQQW